MLARKHHLAFAILLHLLYLILDDDRLVNQMLEIWVVSVEQLKLDLIIETLEKCILLLLIGVDVIDGIPRQLNELIQVFAHHHTSLVQIWDFLLCQLKDAIGHVVSPETSLELIPVDSLDVGVAVAVSLPLICCSSKQLVCHEKNLLTVKTMGYLQLLLDWLPPVLYNHGILGLRENARVGPQKFTQPRLGWWWWCLLLQVRLQVMESLQHCLHQLVLVGNELLKQWVDLVVSVATLAVAVVPHVHHLSGF
jgi:hypothetical protein